MQYPIKKVEQEFFKRTFQLVRTWENQKTYEVTFLINCLYGVIIVAQANFYKSLNFKLSYNIKDIIYKEAGIEKEINEIKIQNLLTVFRNSLAHYGDQRNGYKNGVNNIQLTNDGVNIERIIFNNKKEKVKLEFKNSRALFNFICKLEEEFKNKGII
ncbi:MAG: HEPN family nuclease [Fusobacteriaceae bacterium]